MITRERLPAFLQNAVGFVLTPGGTQRAGRCRSPAWSRGTPGVTATSQGASLGLGMPRTMPALQGRAWLPAAASRRPEYISSRGCCSWSWVKTCSATTPNPKRLQMRQRKTAGPLPHRQHYVRTGPLFASLSPSSALLCLGEASLPPSLPPTPAPRVLSLATARPDSPQPHLPLLPPHFRDARRIWG